MTDISLGIFALAVGGLFVARGGHAMRAIIAFWGALAGFSLGAAAGAYFARTEEILSEPLGWVLAILGALAFVGIAYAFYEAAIALMVASVGYGLGTLLAGAVGASASLASWIGLAAGIVLAVIAIITRFAYALLVFVSASGGASAMVVGLMLILGMVTAEELYGATSHEVISEWWLSLIWLALFVSGLVVQFRLGPPEAQSDQQNRPPAE